MGFYEGRVLPRMLNVACGTKMVEPLRRRVCEGLAGDVVEIGFGSGLNIPFYPAAVTRVVGREPVAEGDGDCVQGRRPPHGPSCPAGTGRVH